MKRAFLFPGQGSQYAGMGHDLFEAYPAARAVFEEADEVLGFSLTDCCFAGDSADVLVRTEVCQPAVLTHAMAAFQSLDRTPDVVAGHSVGEFSALVACGAIKFADGLRLVRRRGELMGQTGRDRPGGMCAVLGLPEREVEAVCTALSRDGQVLQSANFNAPGQIVLSGDRQAVQEAVALAKARGARRVIPLAVSGAFHSVLMHPIQDQFARHVADVPIADPMCPIYLNTTARATTDPDTIRHNMLRQLTSPVRWKQSVRAMEADGVGSFVEVGPGRVLAGLVKRTLGRTTPVARVGTRMQVEQMQHEF